MQCTIFVRGVINARKKIETSGILLPIDVGILYFVLYKD